MIAKHETPPETNAEKITARLLCSAFRLSAEPTVEYAKKWIPNSFDRVLPIVQEFLHD
jgi:hypothetical protein